MISSQVGQDFYRFAITRYTTKCCNKRTKVRLARNTSLVHNRILTLLASQICLGFLASSPDSGTCLKGAVSHVKMSGKLLGNCELDLQRRPVLT